MNKIKTAVAAGALSLLTLTGCGSLIKTDQQTQALWGRDRIDSRRKSWNHLR